MTVSTSLWGFGVFERLQIFPESKGLYKILIPHNESLIPLWVKTWQWWEHLFSLCLFTIYHLRQSSKCGMDLVFLKLFCTKKNETKICTKCLVRRKDEKYIIVAESSAVWVCRDYYNNPLRVKFLGTSAYFIWVGMEFFLQAAWKRHPFQEIEL